MDSRKVDNHPFRHAGVRRSPAVVVSIIVFSIIFLIPPLVHSFTDTEVARLQSTVRNRDTGERIAFWAEQFVGTPYDRDPRGEYVSRRVIVSDERVDCLYHAFRSLELALADTPGDAVQVALDKRFRAKGVMEKGVVMNYEDRFEYGEDMIDSGKWGKEITASVGKTTTVKGTRGKGPVDMLSTEELCSRTGRLRSGDFVFFIRNPKKRTRDELVGHIGIVKVEHGDGRRGDKVYLIHAKGTKKKGGVVRKVLLEDYLRKTSHIGARITRYP